jgi:hypothetical protein
MITLFVTHLRLQFLIFLLPKTARFLFDSKRELKTQSKMKCITRLVVSVVVVLCVFSVTSVHATGEDDSSDLNEYHAGFFRLRHLGTGEKPSMGTKKEKKTKVEGDAKDKVVSKGKGMGTKGDSVTDPKSKGDNGGKVNAPTSKTSKGMNKSPDTPNETIPPSDMLSDVPSSVYSLVPSTTP